MAEVKGFYQKATIPLPTPTLESLYATCSALKEAVDVLISQRGAPEEWAVLRRDLVLIGLMTNTTYPFVIPPRSDYVPGLGFGDPPRNAGMTYQAPTPLGRWYRVGSLVFFTAVIQLAAKGTATGQASFTLPFLSRSTPKGYFFCPCRAYNITGATSVVARITPGSDHAFLWQAGGAAAPLPITDGNFTNTTEIGCSGWYEAQVLTTPEEASTNTFAAASLQHLP